MKHPRSNQEHPDQGLQRTKSIQKNHLRSAEAIKDIKKEIDLKNKETKATFKEGNLRTKCDACEWKVHKKHHLGIHVVKERAQM